MENLKVCFSWSYRPCFWHKHSGSLFLWYPSPFEPIWLWDRRSCWLLAGTSTVCCSSCLQQRLESTRLRTLINFFAEPNPPEHSQQPYHMPSSSARNLFHCCSIRLFQEMYARTSSIEPDFASNLFQNHNSTISKVQYKTSYLTTPKEVLLRTTKCFLSNHVAQHLLTSHVERWHQNSHIMDRPSASSRPS